VRAFGGAPVRGPEVAIEEVTGEGLAGTAQLLPCDTLPGMYGVLRLLPDG